jgi:hypothetical protein
VAHPLKDGLKNGFVTGFLPLLHVCSHFAATAICLGAGLHMATAGHARAFSVHILHVSTPCIDVRFPRFRKKENPFEATESAFAATPAAFAVFSTFLSSLAGGLGFGAAVGFAARAKHCTRRRSIARVGASSHRSGRALGGVGWTARESWGVKSHIQVARPRRW